MRQVTRLCSPCLFLSSFLVIHEVADPQTMSSTSFRAEAKPFQNCSSAGRKLDLGASIQGISSMNTTFFFALDRLTSPASMSKASSQLAGSGARPKPWLRSDSWKLCSCWRVLFPASPVCWNVNL